MTDKQFESKVKNVIENKCLTDQVRQRKLEALFKARAIARKASEQGHDLPDRYPIQSSGKLRHDKLREYGHFDYFRR